jgi:DNA-binding NarL/FixJ family response regulator
VENPTIAASLGISERAVKGHVGVLLEKFGVNNRTELALIACRAGFGGA